MMGVITIVILLLALHTMLDGTKTPIDLKSLQLSSVILLRWRVGYVK